MEAALVAVMDHIRDHLDPLMLQYWAKEPSAYEAYRRHRRLYGLPRNEAEEAPAGNALGIMRPIPSF